MASIEEVRDKDGTIFYKVTCYLGRTEDNKPIRKKRTFRPDSSLSKKKREKALQKFVEELEEKCSTGLIVGEETTLQGYSERWLENYVEKELEATTATRYKHGIKTINSRIGYLKLTEIKPSTVLDFLNGLREKGYQRGGKTVPYSEESIRTLKIILSSVLSAAVADGIISNNPCSIRQRQHKKVERKEVRCFSTEEAARFLDVIEKPIPIIVPEHKAKRHGKEVTIPEFQQGTLDVQLKFRVLYCLTIFSGLRRGELLGLQWKDIDFTEKSIEVNRTIQYTPSQGIFIKPPKTQSGFRKIFLPEVVMQKLTELRREQRKQMLSLGTAWKGSRKPNENFVFTQETGEPMFPSTPRAELSRILKTYNKSCKVESDKLPMISLHELRHTSASILISQGLEATAVAQRLGHSDASITLQVYAHSFAERDKAASDALESALLPTAKCI